MEVKVNGFELGKVRRLVKKLSLPCGDRYREGISFLVLKSPDLLPCRYVFLSVFSLLYLEIIVSNLN